MSEAAAAGTQSLRRAAGLLRLIGAGGRDGCRLSDLARLAGLEPPTAHRILQCLIEEGMVARDAPTRRYRLGPVLFELGLAAAPRRNWRKLCEPALIRIAERTGDTVFLSVRSGLDSVCLDRREGPFPIRTLTLDVGQRRPLGVGAGGLALLMGLPDEEAARIVTANAGQIAGYPNIGAEAVLEMLGRAHDLGYALNDRQVTPGAISVALALPNGNGPPLAAVSIGAITSRMSSPRQRELVAILREELGGIGEAGA